MLSDSLGRFFIKLLLVATILTCPFASYASNATAMATGSVSLDTVQATAGYPAPIYVKATAINNAAFGSGMNILLTKNGQVITSLPIAQGPTANSVVFMITPGLAAGEYDITFNQSSGDIYQARFSIVAPSVQLLEGSQPFLSASYGYAPKTIAVIGTHTNFLSATTVTITRTGSAAAIPNKISSIVFQDAARLSFTLESGLAAGEYIIRIVNNGAAMEHKFVVNAAFSGIAVKAEKSTLETSEEIQLQVIGQSGGQDSADLTRSASITYESSDPSLLTVSGTGLVKALQNSSGKPVSVSATLNEGGSALTGTVRFNITAPVTAVNIMPNPIALNVNAVINLRASATYADGTNGDISKEVTWTVGNTNIASVNTSGQLTGKSIGSTTITATKGTKSAVKTVTVAPATSSGQQGETVPSGQSNSSSSENTGELGDSSLPPLNLGTARKPALETSEQSTSLPVSIDKEGTTASVIFDQTAALETIRNAADSTFIIPVNGSYKNIEITVPEQILRSLQDKNNDSAIKIVSDKAEFTVPAAALKLDELKAKLGLPSSADVEVRILIQETESLTAAKANSDALNTGSRMVIAPIDFKVELKLDEKIVPISSFDRTYVTRSFEVQSSQINPDRTTAAMYIPELRTFRHVPTKFALTEQGTLKASFKRNGNSIYTLLDTQLSFKDVNNAYWAKQDIDIMASKLILQGVGDGLFKPEGRVTRAQFASMIVRAIGLLPEKASGKFYDVPANAWYAGEIQAAYQAGIISGRSEHKFDPNAPILRQEMAAIIVKAMIFSGKSPEDVAKNSNASLSKFKDRESISAYARSAVAYAASQGIISGMTGGTFQANAPATRAQASTVVLRMLRALDFIN